MDRQQKCPKLSDWLLIQNISARDMQCAFDDHLLDSLILDWTMPFQKKSRSTVHKLYLQMSLNIKSNFYNWLIRLDESNLIPCVSSNKQVKENEES